MQFNPVRSEGELSPQSAATPTASSEVRLGTVPAGTDSGGLSGTGLVGESPAIGSIKDVAASIAARRSTVLILGETGTGKEMLARHIHLLSDRSHKTFIPVDCSSLTESLFESQLFGHVKGAFTGAIRDSLGFVRAADGGTLFLDEVGELPLAMQAKLLRMIQERAVTPVGDTQSHSVDVRFIAATNRDLATMVREGTFREDLYFRLNVISMNVPPLRERPTDVLPLARHFLQQQADLYGEQSKKLSPEARAALCDYSWPGNVRELANVIEHAHVLAGSDEIRSSDLPERLRSIRLAAQELGSDLRLVDLERRAFAEAMRRTKHNKAAAARLLGLNIQKFNRMLVKMKLDQVSA